MTPLHSFLPEDDLDDDFDEEDEDDVDADDDDEDEDADEEEGWKVTSRPALSRVRVA
jgi:hypothetical protein